MAPPLNVVYPTRYATVEYALYLKDGTLVDRGEFVYRHGFGHIHPKLEEALEGKRVGESVEVVLTPEEGFGEFKEELVREMPRADFKGMPLVPGKVLYMRDEMSGEVMAMTILEVRDDTVLVDFNHPLAGETVRYVLKVKDVGLRPPPGYVCDDKGCRKTDTGGCRTC
ncbi:MAG: peptidylprolyl isomerase [Thermotogae bacterium]|nr:peptidylprolyl isomerase [Thermotogota bacterium]